MKKLSEVVKRTMIGMAIANGKAEKITGTDDIEIYVYGEIGLDPNTNKLYTILDLYNGTFGVYEIL